MASGCLRRRDRGRWACPSNVPFRITTWSVVMVLLSDRFHKSVDWILRGEGNYPDSWNPLRTRRKRQRVQWLAIGCQPGETTALKCLRPVPIGLPLPQYVTFGNTRLAFLRTFLHPIMKAHHSRSWCSRLELGKQQHQHRLGLNVFSASGRSFACL